MQRVPVLRSETNLEPTMTLPEFLVVGAEKCGTTWLYRMLEQHSEVCMPLGCKETWFFNEFYDRGLAYYAYYFRHCLPHQKAG